MPGAHVGQKRVSDSLELEYTQLLATMCMLGIEPRSSERTVFLTPEPSLWPQEYNFL